MSGSQHTYAVQGSREAYGPVGGIPSGLLAVGIVAHRLGHPLDMKNVMKSGGFSDKELSSRDIMHAAELSGLRSTGLMLKWSGLKSISSSIPIIVINKDGTSMVVNSVKSCSDIHEITLLDPLVNNSLIRLNRRDFMSMWTGEVILFQISHVQKDGKRPFSLALIAKLILYERAMLRDICISALMMSLLALTPILFFRIASERVLPFHAISTFIVVCCVALILIVFETVFGALRRYLLLRLTTRIDVKLSAEMFSRVLNLPVSYFERTPAGLTLHSIGQLGRVRNFLVGQLFGTILDAGILLFFVPVMFALSPLLTSVALAFAFTIFIWLLMMLPAYRMKSGAVEEAEAQRGAFLSQSIQGIRTVKSLALETRQIREWDLLTAKVARLRFEENNLANIIQSLITPLERLMVTGSFGLGVYLALRDNNPANISSLTTFMLLSQRLSSPLIQASQLINQYDEARTAIGIVGKLVNQPPEEGRSGSGVNNQIKGIVSFSNVRFQYIGASKPALKEVTFEIPQGTTLGVMGRSGSGKTTITRLIQRLNSEYSGLVKVDGIDVRNYDLTHFRSSLGVVLQENFLFSGTIRANITIAKPEATFDEMVNAARLAGAEEFIEKLPNGYETYVYEGSPNLSGGQRQRLAIARALITDPKILILDEATSALDAESEAIVNANIERISQGRTVITISHRLASLVKADAILVMEQGEVNDIGKHHELLERNEIYANLWYTQNPHTAAPTASRPQLTYRGPQSVA